MSVNEDPSTWRLKTAGGIPIKSVNLTGSFGEEDAQAVGTFIIESNQLLNLIVEGFPATSVVGGTVFYPRRAFLPGLPTLTVKNVSFKGLVDGVPVDPFGSDSSAPVGTYQDFLEVQITYGTSPQNDTERDPNNPFTFLEVSANASGEVLASPVRGKEQQTLWELRTGDGGDGQHVEIDIPQPVIQSLVEYNLRWTQIPFSWFNTTLMNRLRTKMGKVNQTAMPIFNDAPPETIMFIGFSRSNQFTWRSGNTGTSPIAADLKFLEKNFEAEDGTGTVQVTHNHMYRGGFGWRRLTIDGTPLYDEDDLNEIFSA